ncbi:MAG: proton-conducting transporter membrane subunit, partial [Planctomycetota bacterium]
MVDPILLIAVPLAVAFLLPLFGRLGRPVAVTVHGATVLFVTAAAASWLPGLLDGSVTTVDVTTGGWAAPVGIGLSFGLPEAVLCALAGLTALASLVALTPREDEETHGRSGLLQLLVLVGAIGLFMTRDLFNLFVFLEISAIGTAAMVAFGREDRALEAGFKYMLIGAAASAFLLIAIAFLYKLTGTLSLAEMPALAAAAPAAAMGIVLTFLLAGFAIELKLIPVNGPALDLYDGAEPAVMALVTGATVNGVLFAFFKVSALFPDTWYGAMMVLGMLTFVGGNLLATMQDRPRRMLGYSSSAQIGLLVFLIPLVRAGTVPPLAAALLLINHTLAKPALLWLAGAVKSRTLEGWTGAFSRGPARLLLVIAILAITGLPPFPGFWGKWQALTGMAGGGMTGWIAVLLVGSLFEFICYYRWYRRVQEEASTETEATSSTSPATRWTDLFGPALFGIGATAIGLYFAHRMTGPAETAVLITAAAGVVLVLLKRLPGGLLNMAAMGVIAVAATLLQRSGGLAPDTLSGLFGILVIVGGFVVILAGTSGHGGAKGPVPGLLLILIASLLMLVRAE